MFERFTTEARAAVAQAHDEARLLGDATIGAQHLLIGLAGIGDDAASRVLRSHEVLASATPPPAVHLSRPTLTGLQNPSSTRAANGVGVAQRAR